MTLSSMIYKRAPDVTLLGSALLFSEVGVGAHSQTHSLPKGKIALQGGGEKWDFCSCSDSWCGKRRYRNCSSVGTVL